MWEVPGLYLYIVFSTLVSRVQSYMFFIHFGSLWDLPEGLLGLLWIDFGSLLNLPGGPLGLFGLSSGSHFEATLRLWGGLGFWGVPGTPKG